MMWALNNILNEAGFENVYVLTCFIAQLVFFLSLEPLYVISKYNSILLGLHQILLEFAN